MQFGGRYHHSILAILVTVHSNSLSTCDSNLEYEGQPEGPLIFCAKMETKMSNIIKEIL